MRRAIEGVFATHPDEVDCITAMIEEIQGTKPVLLGRSPRMTGVCSAEVDHRAGVERAAPGAARAIWGPAPP